MVLAYSSQGQFKVTHDYQCVCDNTICTIHVFVEIFGKYVHSIFFYDGILRSNSNFVIMLSNYFLKTSL